MYTKFDIWDYIEFLAKSRVKSFYPDEIVRALKLPLYEVIDELNNILISGRLILKFEIRCDDCFKAIKIVEDFTDYIGKELYCEDSKENIEITKYNIYPLYEINAEYKKHLKKKNCIRERRNHLKDLQLI